MRRILVYLTEKEYNGLRAVAERERREPQAQAAVFVARALAEAEPVAEPAACERLAATVAEPAGAPALAAC